MKRQLLLILMIALFSKTCFAVDPDQPAPKSFFGIGTGLNSCQGLLGVQYEQVLGKRGSVFGAVGLGTWGMKASVGTRLYRQSPYGSALAIQLLASTGANKVKNTLEVDNGVSIAEQPVEYDVHTVYVLGISWFKGWQVRAHNRINIELGYGILLSNPMDNNYSLRTPGVTLTRKSKDVINAVQPGGLIVSFAYCFGR